MAAGIIPLRSAWQGHYENGSNTSTRRFRSSYANAHVANGGCLGIHEADHQAFGNPATALEVTPEVGRLPPAYTQPAKWFEKQRATGHPAERRG